MLWKFLSVFLMGNAEINFMKNANDCKFLCSGRDYKCQQLHLCFIENFRSDNGSCNPLNLDDQRMAQKNV